MANTKDQNAPRSGLGRPLLVVLAIALSLAGAEFGALWRSNHPNGGRPDSAVTADVAAKGGSNATSATPQQPAVDATAPAAVAPAAPPVGAIDTPAGEAVVGPHIALSGWALARAGIRTVEIRIEGLRLAAATGIARPDVAQVEPGYPDSARAGFEFVGDLTSHAGPANADRRTLTIVAIDKNGRETILATKSVIEQTALTRWRDIPFAQRTPFYLLPALSGIGLGAARGLADEYAYYVSSTLRTGLRVPILYLRTTKGPQSDYTFDPDWDIEHRCGKRRIAEDSLNGSLELAAHEHLPLLVTLNGGIWADAACDAPEFDINDRLEQDKANCQWNEKNEVMPDDVLKNLPGSQDAPELGRSLTFNVYARAVRHYKKRNLQAAAAYLVAYRKAHPDLWLGINLDPDTYLNPFFNETQWYDYNPGTLRQFREWLAGVGPYAGRPERGVPDLSRYRRARPLTLAQVSKLAGRTFARWQDVDPPRAFSRDPAHPFWNDPWIREWELFRRHLVHLHYDELAHWLVEAGVPQERIWSSQGFMAPSSGAMPFAVSLDSPVKNYDSGGMTVEGSKPRDGHLGAILYGASAVNDIPMENGLTLFATLARIDPQFAVVEFNTADLRDPKTQPSYVAAYRALRDLWNSGARFVSPMAWNGSNGRYAGAPDYVTFTAWRNTPLEDAARDFLLSRADLPLGTRLWTFGTPHHADDDGWTAERGTVARTPGALRVTPDAEGLVRLLSPAGLYIDNASVGRLVVGLPADRKVARLDVEARAAGTGEWQSVVNADQPAIAVTHAGVLVARNVRGRGVGRFDQVRLTLRLDNSQPVDVARIAILPAK